MSKRGLRWATPIAARTRFAEAVGRLRPGAWSCSGRRGRRTGRSISRAPSPRRASKTWDAAEADLQEGADDCRPTSRRCSTISATPGSIRTATFPRRWRCWRRRARLSPYDGYIADSVGWAYYKLGRFEDAAQGAGGGGAAGAGRSHDQRSSGRCLLAGGPQARRAIPVEPRARVRSDATRTRP